MDLKEKIAGHGVGYGNPTYGNVFRIVLARVGNGIPTYGGVVRGDVGNGIPTYKRWYDWRGAGHVSGMETRPTASVHVACRPGFITRRARHGVGIVRTTVSGMETRPTLISYVLYDWVSFFPSSDHTIPILCNDQTMKTHNPPADGRDHDAPD